ncbi:MAG: winged helix-turn-helix transcriptional regulator [Candidatus Thorarchaeota archaeon]
MSSQWTKRILVLFSFMLITWGIIGVALSSSGFGGLNLISQDIPTTVNDNQVALDLSFTLSTASSGTINITADAIAWAGIGTLTFWNHWIINSIDLGFVALIIGTVSIERFKDKRILKLRDRIAGEVTTNPGIHLREIHRNLGCAMGALQYHLTNLENDGLVVSLRAGNVRHLFPPGYSTEDRVLLLTALARNPTVGSILTECMNNGQTTQAEISRGLDVDKSLISYYTSSLLKADILKLVKVFGREKPVILTEWARTELTCSGILADLTDIT